MRLVPVSILLALTGPAAAQRLPFPIPENTNVASATMRQFAPAVAVLSPAPGRQVMHLVALNRDGFGGREFDSATRRWSDAWNPLGNPTVPAVTPAFLGNNATLAGFDTGLVLFPHQGVLQMAMALQRAPARVFGGFSELLTAQATGARSVLVPETVVSFEVSARQPGGTGTWLAVRSGLSDGQCALAYGTSHPTGEPLTDLQTTVNDDLVEARNCLGQWRFDSHGNPVGRGALGLGPQGAAQFGPVKLIGVGHGAFRDASRTYYAGVAVRQSDLADPDRDTWVDLGAPRSGRIYGAPLLVVRPTFAAAGPEVSVLAVVQTRNEFGDFDHYALFERKRVGLLGTWSPWDNLQRPRGLGESVPFRVTSGVVWHGGVQDRAHQRLNVFGFTEPGAGQGAPSMLHLWSERQTWAWGDLYATPDARAVASQSSAVIDLPGYVRTSVFVRLSNGRIYEHFYDGSSAYWQWTNLTNDEFRARAAGPGLALPL